MGRQATLRWAWVAAIVVAGVSTRHLAETKSGGVVTTGRADDDWRCVIRHSNTVTVHIVVCAGITIAE